MANKDAQPKQDKEAGLGRAVVAQRFVSKYDPEVALIIVEQLSEGNTLNKICRGVPGMPHPTTFKRWMVNNPELAKAYGAAMQLSASSLEEEALDTARAIAKNPVDGTHVRAAEVHITQLRWSAERRDPATFGQKSQINIRIPVQIITPLDLGDVGGGPSATDIYTLKAETIKEVTLVPDKPMNKGGGTSGPRKVVLTPRNPFYTIGDKRDKNRLRKQGSEEGNREEHGGNGNKGVHHQQPAQNTSTEKQEWPGQDTPSGGERQ